MPNSYGKSTDQERHYKSLEASAEIAEKASMLALERNWPYETAVKYVMKTEPELSELSKHGYISEKPAKNYSMSSHEASAELAEKTKKLMRSEGVPFDVAQTRVYKENPELVKIWTMGD